MPLFDEVTNFSKGNENRVEEFPNMKGYVKKESEEKTRRLAIGKKRKIRKNKKERKRKKRRRRSKEREKNRLTEPDTRQK